MTGKITAGVELMGVGFRKLSHDFVARTYPVSDWQYGLECDPVAAPTTISVLASPNPAVTGQAVLITAQVALESGTSSSPFTGKILFVVDAVPMCDVPISSTGTAACTFTFSQAGSAHFCRAIQRRFKFRGVHH